MIHPTLSGLALGLGLLPLAGCPLLDLQVDVPEVCLSYPNLVVQSTPGATGINQSFSFNDLSAVHDLASHDASLHFVRARVRARSGIAGFAFVEAARLVVASGDPGTALPPLTMYDCDGDCVPDGDRLDIPAAVGADAIAYLRADAIVIDLALRGTIPAASWTMDVDVCMSARASVTLAP
jgi:hypothetical protein